MCGIVGVFQYPSPVSRELRAKALRILFPRIMLNTEVRGDDATGVYQVREDHDWMLLKKGQKVSEWFCQQKGLSEDPFTFKDTVRWWLENPSDMTTLVGHCRKATSGSRGRENEDNHPFAIQLDEHHAILGVHNGTLVNHERIFERLKELGSPLPRQGEVDSESIFHLLYHISHGGIRPWTAADLKYAAERIDGAYAVVASNSRFPKHVAVMRKERPLEMFMIRPLNILVLASEKKFVEDALGVYGLVQNFLVEELPTLNYEDRILPERNFRIFDLDKPFPETEKLAWGDFDKISEGGELQKFANLAVTAGWKKGDTTKAEVKTIPTEASILPMLPSKTSQPTVIPPVEAKVSKPATPSFHGPAVPPAEQERVLVKTEIEPVESDEDDICSEQEAASALLQGRYLGLSPYYEGPNEVAGALGITAGSIDTMSKTELANKIGNLHFLQGYALGLTDSKAEVEKVRAMGRKLTENMDRLAEKKQRAEKHIWEIRTALVAATILAENSYYPTGENVRKALEALQHSELDGPRIETVVKLFLHIVEDHRVKRERERLGKIIKKKRSGLLAAKAGHAED